MTIVTSQTKWLPKLKTIVTARTPASVFTLYRPELVGSITFWICWYDVVGQKRVETRMMVHHRWCLHTKLWFSLFWFKCTVRLFGDGDGGGEENCHFPQRQRDAEGWKIFLFSFFLETLNIFHGWVSNAHALIHYMHKPTDKQGDSRSRMLIQGVFFNWYPPKSTKKLI